MAAETTSDASSVKRLSDIDFLVNWHDLIGQPVTIDRCVIAGTTADFLRCETINGAGQVVLDTDTMDRAA